MCKNWLSAVGRSQRSELFPFQKKKMESSSNSLPSLRDRCSFGRGSYRSSIGQRQPPGRPPRMRRRRPFRSAGLSLHTQVPDSHLEMSGRCSQYRTQSNNHKKRNDELHLQCACNFSADMSLLLIEELGKPKIRDLGGEVGVK